MYEIVFSEVSPGKTLVKDVCQVTIRVNQGVRNDQFYKYTFFL